MNSINALIPNIYTLNMLKSEIEALYNTDNDMKSIIKSKPSQTKIASNLARHDALLIFLKYSQLNKNMTIKEKDNPAKIIDWLPVNCAKAIEVNATKTFTV